MRNKVVKGNLKATDNVRYMMESQRENDISAFFEPSAVAVLGSLKDNGGPGYGAIKNMLDFG